MINNSILADIFDILVYEETTKETSNDSREFSALSYRIASKKSCFRYNDKTVYTCSGDICYVPKNTTYKRISQGEKLIVFHFNENHRASRDIIIFSPDNTEKYRILFEKAFAVWQKKSPGYRYHATALFYEILAELLSDGMSFSPESDKDISLALDIIEKNFSDANFHTSTLANQMYMSETYLRRKFKTVMGTSPKKYITSRRIEEAEIMLRSGYFSHTEIALKCGFSDVKYFRTAFKNNTGKTISRYKSEI